ncbi:MAG TPA: glycosyltransferase [Myxococcota bacterium]|nr:glycosyltransferase [Myxococcota bacterium]
MGGHGARKGEDDALRAWALLPARTRRAYRLRIIGVQPEERRDELRRAARRLLGDEPIAIDGGMSREDYLEHLATARLAVSCSRLEAFGLPVAEALVMGAPVLATDLPSHRELLARAGAGKTFAAGDVRALAASIARALNGEPPPRLTSPPIGWSWRDRARQHIDAYQTPA